MGASPLPGREAAAVKGHLWEVKRRRPQAKLRRPVARHFDFQGLGDVYADLSMRRERRVAPPRLGPPG